MQIAGRNIGSEFSPYIIAELSANHNGSLARALESIKAAKDAGASAVKIQTYTADTITIDSDRPEFMIRGGLWDGYKLYDLYKWAETPYEWHGELFAFAESIGITIFSTPFDNTAVDLLESLNAPAYKIASFELIDIPLIRYVASTRKPMIMSTGMASEDEIEEAVQTARDGGCNDIILLHCISSYPAPLSSANLAKLSLLRNRFGVQVGLSDHTLGTTASVAAVALGATVIEKHFTLSRADKGPDCEFSLEPDELKQLCDETCGSWSAIGTPSFDRAEEEQASLVFRRSLYFVKDLPAGHVITEGDVRSIRPGFGLMPRDIHKCYGKKLIQEVFRGQPCQPLNFEEFDNEHDS
jgi:pseudaminic acid synthase